jgi:hypothetical protein
MVDRFAGSLFGKVLLSRVRPLDVHDGVVTIGGRMDALELKQIEACRKGIEGLLHEDFGVPLQVKFVADDRESSAPPTGANRSEVPAPAATGGGGPAAANDLPPAWEPVEPEWPELEPEAPDRALDDDTELPLVEAAARMFGAEVVPD